MRWCALLLVIAACADGSDRRRPRIDGGAALDASAPDAAPDAPALDAPALDASGVDGGSVDAASMDAAPVDGGGSATACTPETAPAVCGGRPCVDGFCCDRVCGPCESCGIAGLEGTCTAVTGFGCDDGNPCTHGETCMAGGVCGGGTPLDCDAMDTTCRDFSCDGTATCASAPRAVGMGCDDGDATTTGDMCQADGSCMGTVGGCALPGDACASGSQSRDRCSGARIIGRSAAATGGGYVATGDTCSARNRFDDCSWDAGNDHAYRIWLRAGERVEASTTRRNTCFSGYSITLKFYEPTDCTSVVCSSDRWCHDFVSNGEVFGHTATVTGWHVVVVDGSTAFDDEGEYTLTVRLTGCATPGCEC